MSKNRNGARPNRREAMALAAAGLLPAAAQARTPATGFGPCSGFVAAAPGRRRAWTRGEAPEGRPFRENSPFRIASVSKMVAAAVIVPLAAARPGGLDADVSEGLGFSLRHPAWPDRPIRLRHLLSHTSGLRNGPSYPVPAGRPLAAALLPGGAQYDGGGWFGPPAFPPGARFSYADVNFAVLAQWAEVVTGQRFDRLMRERLLAPAGTEAGYNWSGTPEAARRRAAPGPEAGGRPMDRPGRPGAPARAGGRLPGCAGDARPGGPRDPPRREWIRLLPPGGTAGQPCRPRQACAALPGLAGGDAGNGDAGMAHGTGGRGQ